MSLSSRGMRMVALAALLTAFAVFVWPTMYRPIPLSAPGLRLLAARENRVTGQVELLTRQGWARVPPPVDALDSLLRKYGGDQSP